MKLSTGPNRGGRPRVHKEQSGDRIPMGFRASLEMKRALEKACLQNGRSLAQEIERRIDSTLERDELLFDILALRHGKIGAGVMMMLSRALQAAEQFGAAAYLKEGREWKTDTWLDDPEMFAAVARAFAIVMHDLEPSNVGATRAPGWEVRGPPPIEHVGDFAAYTAMIDGTSNYQYVKPGKERRASSVRPRTPRRFTFE